MKKLLIVLMLFLVYACASKKPKMSREELSRLRTQPVTIDISEKACVETKAQKEIDAKKPPVKHTTKEEEWEKQKRQTKASAAFYTILSATIDAIH
ncbi:hypothetical protein [Desulfovibrio sp. UCD-KL4C]|uniref:hypothetical protein n=1 Tax=Desulfovibrio sp. UCD-KL4C TaxID=2578120 RepID=UPI0025C0D282|nr:hypothetical protein [Desulfovibrio sp. UCD-KL4C]